MNIYVKMNLQLLRWLTRPLAGLMFRMSKVDEQFDTLVRLIEKEADKQKRGNDDKNRP
jgi:hypothetical protein